MDVLCNASKNLKFPLSIFLIYENNTVHFLFNIFRGNWTGMWYIYNKLWLNANECKRTINFNFERVTIYHRKVPPFIYLEWFSYKFCKDSETLYIYMWHSSCNAQNQRADLQQLSIGFLKTRVFSAQKVAQKLPCTELTGWFAKIIDWFS